MIASESLAPRESHGRTTIAARAIDRVVTAIAADALGVPRTVPRIDVGDIAGDIDLTVRSPISSPELGLVRVGSGVVDRSGGTVLDRADRAQGEIASRVTEITGSRVGRVTVVITGATIAPTRRVT